MIHARLKPNFDFGLMTNDELLGIVETGDCTGPGQEPEKWGIRGL